MLTMIARARRATAILILRWTTLLGWKHRSLRRRYIANREDGRCWIVADLRMLVSTFEMRGGMPHEAPYEGGDRKLSGALEEVALWLLEDGGIRLEVWPLPLLSEELTRTILHEWP